MPTSLILAACTAPRVMGVVALVALLAVVSFLTSSRAGGRNSSPAGLPVIENVVESRQQDGGASWAGRISSSIHTEPIATQSVIGRTWLDVLSRSCGATLTAQDHQPQKQSDHASDGREHLELRIMVVGDSISHGLAPASKRKKKTLRRPWLHPEEGLCSYRTTLFQSLATAMNQRKAPVAFAPRDHCKRTLPLNGSTPARDGLGGGALTVGGLRTVIKFTGPYRKGKGGPHPDRCAVEAETHAATWGITAKEVANTLSEPLDQEEDFPLSPRSKSIYVLPPTQKDEGRGSFVEEGNVILQKGTTGKERHSQTRAEYWVRRYRPDLVFFLIGTNDLQRNDGNIPKTFPTGIVPLLTQLLAPEAGSAAKVAKPHDDSVCRLRIVMPHLLPRDDDVAKAVHLYNEELNWLVSKEARERHCVGNLTVEGTGATDRLKDLQEVKDAGTHKQTQSPRSYYSIFCSNCIHVVGSPSPEILELPGRRTMLYDGLHPSPEGEQMIGRFFAAELLR
jgi:hypothetical protein